MDRSLDYGTLADGLRALDNGARFLATNEDCTYPTPAGPLPGAGSIVGAFRGMGFAPQVSIGKPSTLLFDAALEIAGCEQSRTLMIGDRLETDIEGAIRSGLDSLLVFTGISRHADIARTGIEPTWTSVSLADAVAGSVLPGRRAPA
jgi:4-nitrophenyl phosphatase